MLRIIQARLGYVYQQYVYQELPDVQVGFRKGGGNRNQTVNIHWIIEKAREFHKIIYFGFIDYTKALAFCVWITTNCLNFLKRQEYQTTLSAL